MCILKCNEKSNNLIIIYSQCLLSMFIKIYVEFIYLYEYFWVCGHALGRNNSG